MEEIWKLIDGYDNYKISNLGNFASLDKTGSWVIRKSYKAKCGYLYVILYKKGKRKNRSIHSLVADAFVPGWFSGAEVNHKDLNKLNNCVDNLEWVTRSENQLHQVITHGRRKETKYCAICGRELSESTKGNYCAGCYKHMAKIEQRKNIWPTKEQLLEDLQYMPILEIGRKYNYSENNIRKICRAYALPYKKEDIVQYRKECGTYVPPKNSFKKSLKERYTFYEVAGLSMTATEWSRYLGLERKRIRRYANKHSYEETVQYITEWLNKIN